MRQFVAPWKEVQRRTATAELGGIRFSRGASRGRSRCCSMSSAVVPHGGARPNAPARAGSALVDHDLLWYADLPQAAEPRRCEARARGKPWPTAGRGWIGAATAVRRLAGARPPQARSRASPRRLSRPHRPGLASLARRRGAPALVARARRCAVQNSPDVPAGAMGGGPVAEARLGVAADTPSLAWSYELITPESGILLGAPEPAEVGFELLMAQHAEEVLGEAVAERFGSRSRSGSTTSTPSAAVTSPSSATRRRRICARPLDCRTHSTRPTT